MRRASCVVLAAMLGSGSVAASAGEAPGGAKQGEDARAAGRSPEEIIIHGRKNEAVDARIQQTRESHPGSVVTVSPKELALQSASNLGEVLARIPGVAYIDEDGRGTKPDIGLRGLDPVRSQYVQILHDDVPTQPSLYSEQAAYYGVPAERVAGIEVWKGGSAILFGPNTVGGVVNLISRSPSEEPFATALDARFDSRRDYLGSAFVSGTRERLSYGLELMHKGGEGFRDGLEYRIDDLETTLAYQFDEDHSARVHFQYYDENSETPGGLLPDQFDEDREQSNKPNDEFYGKRIQGDLRTSHRLTDRQRLDTLLYAYFYERNWFIQNFVSNGTTDLSLADNNGQFLREFRVVGFEPRYTLDYDLGATSDHELSVGARIYYDDVDRRSATGNSGDSRAGDGVPTSEEELGTLALAVYLQNELRLTDRLSVVPGVRYEHIRQHRTDVLQDLPKEKSAYDVFAPGLGIKWELAARTLAYANATRSFRPPTFGDSFNPATAASSFDLEASTAWTYEAGLRSNPYAWLQADLGGFYSEFEDQVVISGSVAANYDTRASGFEGSFQLGLLGLADALRTGDPNRERAHELFLLGGATIVHSRFASGAFDGNDLPYVPDQSFTFGLMYELRDRLNLALQGRYVGARFTDNANTGPEDAIGTIGRLAAYTVIDIKTRWQANDRVTINAGIDNLLDESYGTQRRTGSQKGIFPGPTRAFYVSASLAY